MLMYNEYISQKEEFKDLKIPKWNRLQEGARNAPPPSKFFQFYAVWGKFWQNRMLVPPPRGSWRPLLGEIVDPSLDYSFGYFREN